MQLSIKCQFNACLLKIDLKKLFFFFTDPIKYLYIYNIQGYIGSNIFNDVVLRLCASVSTAIWVCLL